MNRFCAISVALGGLAILAGCSMAQLPQNPANAQKVDAVIERSKSTRVTYSIYNWNIVNSPDGAAREEWSAEFNMANQHRVETPRDRIVADCQAQVGSWFNLESGATETGAGQAMAACGINTNRPFLTKDWLGPVTTPFGPADRVRVSDHDLVGTYDVNSDGVILRTVFETNDTKRSRVLLDVAVSYSADVPDTKMFDKSSLEKSYVPEAWTRAPAVPIT